MHMTSTRKHVALIGATGGSGSAILRHALERGHRVSALVRNPDKLRGLIGAEIPAALAILRGDATSEADVRSLLLEGPDVLVFAVGTSSLEKSTICYDTAVSVVRAACKLHYRERAQDPALRVITVSGGGLGGKPGLLMEKILVPAFLREPLFDALQMEAALRTAPPEVIESVILRPYRLTDGPATDHFTIVPEDYKAPILVRYTSRADVAQAVVAEVEDWRHGGQIINVFTGGV